MANTTLREHAQRVFFYDRWANHQILDALARMDRPPARAIQRMAHVVAALELWVSRLRGKGNPDTDLFSPGWTIEETQRRLDAAHDAWIELLAPLTDVDLLRRVVWTRFDGDRYEALLRDIVTQLPMHGAYHRGQLSITLKDQLPGPLEIDYIFTTWAPVEAPVG